MVRDMTDEAKALLDQWKKDRDTKDPDNVSAIVQGSPMSRSH